MLVIDQLGAAARADRRVRARLCGRRASRRRRAFGALLHYIVIVSAFGVVIWFAAWPVAMIGGGCRLSRFTRAVAPAQAVAISTQSSLASLPAMLRATEQLGVPVAASGVVLPLAVADLPRDRPGDEPRGRALHRLLVRHAR